MDASALAAQEPKAIGARQPRPVAERLKEARAAGKIDLALLKELTQVDRQSAQEYVDDLKERLAEAEGLLDG
jgi:adenylosuccinate lyase